MDNLRTCSEICIDADNHTDDLVYLQRLWMEIMLNKKKYSLVELEFMAEYLHDKIRPAVRKVIIQSLINLTGLTEENK